MNVVVRRPDRLAAHITGDDGSHDLIYDGKSIAVSSSNYKEYVVVPASGDIPSALERVEQLNADFPLVDFFTEAPDKSFLSGVTAGWQVGTNKVDGVECRHLFFSQRDGIDLELWVEKNDAAVPHRLIVTIGWSPVSRTSSRNSRTGMRPCIRPKPSSRFNRPPTRKRSNSVKPSAPQKNRSK